MSQPSRTASDHHARWLLAYRRRSAADALAGNRASGSNAGTDADEPLPTMTAPTSEPAVPSPSTLLLIALHKQSNPNDVRFYFPSTSSELWANSTVLAAASPYFKSLFDSGFAESTALNASERGNRKRKAPEHEDGFADSDDETDIEHAPAQVDETSDAPHQFHEIIVTSAAHTTYAALLAYIYTSHLEFAPLRSSPAPKDIDTSISTSSSVPLPVSPKSLYQLAHFLSMPTLTALCLDGIKAGLKPDNAAKELFGGVARVYDDVRKVVLEYTGMHWDVVRRSFGLNVVEVERGGPGSDLSIALELARHLNGPPRIPVGPNFLGPSMTATG